MTIRQALLDATQTLQPQMPEARLEASLLLQHSLNKPRSWLIAHDDELVNEQAQQQFNDLLKRRSAGEPLAYITGEKEFWSLTFKVTPDVLIPRPDTELLVETAVEKLEISPGKRLMDMGTGSGAIAISIAYECPAADAVATDVSPAALAVAQQNADWHCPGRIQFVESDWFAELSNECFDLIVSNPPYIEDADHHLASLEFEPLSALASGEDGLDDLRIIIGRAVQHLSPAGWLMVEHGADQGEATRRLFEKAGYTSIETRCDLAGLERITLGCKHG